MKSSPPRAGSKSISRLWTSHKREKHRRSWAFHRGASSSYDEVERDCNPMFDNQKQQNPSNAEPPALPPCPAPGQDQHSPKQLLDHERSRAPPYRPPPPSPPPPGDPQAISKAAPTDSCLKQSIPGPPTPKQLVKHPGQTPTMSQTPDQATASASQDLGMIRQPETRPISQEQLVAEVKGIYAGLVMVESKCIEVDNNQSQKPNQPLSHEQWQALIALHRTLLHEHHDFFLASQHPSASPALRRLASKYAMPARMWRHGIHSFLELLRHRLPLSLEHMLTFIYLAYSMMALLYETVPAFADTWIECLGDLGRYRMAIEDDDIRDRETWTGVSRHWYSKASDKAPTTGRLYHHLAILARPNALQQLFYYCKSLCVPLPFKSAKESILTLLDPVLSGDPRQHVRMSSVDLEFVHITAIFFTGRNAMKQDAMIENWIASLDSHVARSSRRFQESGYFIAIVLICILQDFCLTEEDNRSENKFHQILSKEEEEEEEGSEEEFDVEQSSMALASYPENFRKALNLMSMTATVLLKRHSDQNILHFAYCFLVFQFHIAHYNEAFAPIAPSLPWNLIAQLLNTLVMERADLDLSNVFIHKIPTDPKRETSQPIPEDFAMRGLSVTQKYFPVTFFDQIVDDEDKFFELPSMMEVRKDRILSLGFRIASIPIASLWLQYVPETQRFRPGPKFPTLDLTHVPLGMGKGRVVSETYTDSSFTTAMIPTPSSSGTEDEVMVDATNDFAVSAPASTAAIDSAQY